MALLILVCHPAFAGTINGGFESGLTGWNSTGVVSTEGAGFGTGPIVGASSALLTNGSGSDTDSGIEVLLGLPADSLDDLSATTPGGGNATDGSAIWQSFQANAGDTISFDFIFLTNEEPPDPEVNDFAFASITVDGVLADGVLAVLADTNDPDTASGSVFIEETGVLSFSHVLTAGGTVQLGIGVLDEDDSLIESAMLVDNVLHQPVPEPSSYHLAFVGFASCCIAAGWECFRRRRSRHLT